MSIKGWIEVNDIFCKGCAICVDECPQEVLALDLDRLTAKGYHPVQIIMEGCTGCGLCAIVCPEAALSVYQEIPIRKTNKATA